MHQFRTGKIDIINLLWYKYNIRFVKGFLTAVSISKKLLFTERLFYCSQQQGFQNWTHCKNSNLGLIYYWHFLLIIPVGVPGNRKITQSSSDFKNTSNAKRNLLWEHSWCSARSQLCYWLLQGIKYFLSGNIVAKYAVCKQVFIFCLKV